MAIHILIVDDEPNFLEQVRAILEAADYRVSTAEGPAQAVETVIADRPDLILLDVNLPLEDGFDLSEKLNADKIPILFLTGEPFREKQERVMTSKAAGYIEKPVKPDVLLTWVQQTLVKWSRKAPSKE